MGGGPTKHEESMGLAMKWMSLSIGGCPGPPPQILRKLMMRICIAEYANLLKVAKRSVP